MNQENLIGHNTSGFIGRLANQIVSSLLKAGISAIPDNPPVNVPMKAILNEGVDLQTSLVSILTDDNKQNGKQFMEFLEENGQEIALVFIKNTIELLEMRGKGSPFLTAVKKLIAEFSK